jgi:alcohol dehydrogenase Myb-SANT-like transcription factor
MEEKQSMTFTDADTDKLILLYQESEILWKISSSEYKNTSRKGLVWEEIAKSFGGRFSGKVTDPNYNDLPCSG